MATYPINLTGGTYKHESLPLSAQRTINFWPQLQKSSKMKSKYILESFPGKKLFGTVAGTRDRGMIEHLGVLYKVTDQTLYTVSSNGTHTSIGTIPGAGRCILSPNGTKLVIVTEGMAYLWNGSTVSTISTNIDTPNGAAHLNKFTLYDGDDGAFMVSDVGDPATVGASSFATAESDADDLKRVYVHNQNVYMMGDKTIEPWWNSGNGVPPFDGLEGSIIEVGLAAIYSPASSKDFVYFVGSDNSVWRISGTAAEPIMPQAIVREVSKFTSISDAVGMCYKLDDQWFYEVTYLSADRTFCYPEGGEWFELSSGTSGSKNIASSYAYFARKHLVGDFNSGNIYELDENTYTDNGSTIIRTRDTAPLHGGIFGRDGKEMEMTRFELILETGVGLLSGQGQSPVVMLSFSDDGGRTFGTESWGTIGELGHYRYKVEWFALGRFESRIIRIRVSDPVRYSIHSAAVDIDMCI